MPELTAAHYGLLALLLVIGLILGWILRADRCAREKIAVSASWQEQMESQQSEHGRLAEQNKSLMEQISQYQASLKDHSNRARELSDSLREALAARDELKQGAKDLRSNLDVAEAQRARLQRELKRISDANPAAALKEKDDKIFRLSRELTSWQSRVPPLVERFQERDRRVRELEQELDAARIRIEALEAAERSDQTRIEPLDADSLPDGGDASNEPIAMTSSHDVSGLDDQVGEDDRLADDELVEDESAAETLAANDEAEPLLDEDELVADDPQSDAEYAEAFDSVDTDYDEALPDPDETINAIIADAAELPTAPENDSPTAERNPDEQHEDAADDLQEIKGIGPSIEKTLHELGFTRFQQIADMSEYEIDRVAQQLKGFRSRIYREDWIGQARDLERQKKDPSF